ncbi:hypothetical protein K488DRAFT_87152 [Vararia minispora EC-137]|uniref:Uncharacterized protein n=1 Tax=Vararia minispora EC-137 TaxID=1314806 RepID=A0ACB8QGW9_9AGAM|nr:hypothetical protein K488DRAFT_87152 [Vararia minispora EC-137]
MDQPSTQVHRRACLRAVAAAGPTLPTKRKRKRKFSDDDTAALGDDEHSSAEQSPPRKKRRCSRHECFARRPLHLRTFAFLPSSVILTVCAYLPPRDLLALSRVSKDLRRLVLAPDAPERTCALWRDAFALDDGKTPACPEGMGVLAWTHLIFGDGMCYVRIVPSMKNCGGKALQKILWAFRKRLCRRCVDACLVRQSKITFPDEFPPEYADWALAALPNISPSQNFPLWDRDEVDLWIKRLLDVLRAGGQEDTKGHFGSRVRLQEEIERKRAQTLAGRERETQYVEWEHRQAQAREEEWRAIQEERRSGILSRFEELGYSPADIAPLHKHHDVVAAISKPLADEVWDTLRAKLTPILETRKANRLDNEALQRLEDACVAYWKTLPPALVPYMPSVKHVQEFEPIARALRLGSVDMAAAFAEAANEILRTIEEKKAALASVTPDGGGLDLATAVFQTMSAFSHVCFGPEVLTSIFVHTKFRSPALVQFSTQARDAVAYILRHAGVDTSITREEMDRRDMRFVCLTCKVEFRFDAATGDDVLGRYVYDWRGAVEHIVQVHPASGQEMKVLDKTECDYAYKQEAKALERAAFQAFGCVLCNAHIGPKESSPWMTRSEVNAHLASE